MIREKMDLDNIDIVAKKIWNQFKHHKIWAFYADMGSGKTTFIKALSKSMGIENIVNSPTFSIINEYRSEEFGLVYHFDLFRLNSSSQIVGIGFDEMVDNSDYSFIEWPERNPEYFNHNFLHVSIEIVSETERLLSIEER